MYINNIIDACRSNMPDNKSNRLFRPWDSANVAQNNAQDCTVSTTTRNDEDDDDDMQESIPNVPPAKARAQKIPEKEGFRPILKVSPEAYTELPHQAILPLDYPADPFSMMYPDLLQANLGQSLDLGTSDALFMESMAQGIVLKEYARVLSQEHQAKILAAKKQRPKKYKCPHCDVGFSNNGQLKGHIRIHTGERPFRCDEKECGKTFTRNEELTRHKRIHSGVRPFPCNHCGKCFGRKDHLKKHSRTHFQPRGLYAVPVVLPFETWAMSSSSYPFVPMLY